MGKFVVLAQKEPKGRTDASYYLRGRGSAREKKIRGVKVGANHAVLLKTKRRKKMSGTSVVPPGHPDLSPEGKPVPLGLGAKASPATRFVEGGNGREIQSRQLKRGQRKNRGKPGFGRWAAAETRGICSGRKHNNKITKKIWL